jgi:DNA (cytosine-5)-methyltransferase 1
MPIRTIDLFCGAGGSSVGAQSAGANIVAGFDMWDAATKTYKTNFPNARVYSEDIRKLCPKDIRAEIGDIDLILASPECTNHSVAKGAKERDESSRMTAFEVIRFAAEFKPQWIIVENVVQMQSWSEHGKFLGKLWSLGYFVREVSLNAMDFGVPQTRKRLFLLCSRSTDVKFQEPFPKIHTPVSSIIDYSGQYRQSPLRTAKRSKATIERAERAISVLGSKEPFLIVYYGTDGCGGWQSIKKPLRTVTTLDRFAYVEPSDNGHIMRMLQPEELKLGMGFDDEFKLNIPGLTRRDKIKLMGNGVCPPIMCYIVRTLTRID